MPKLNDQVKAFIVQRLACYATLPDVIEDVKETFGLELKKQHVHYYDPDAPASKTPERWRALHEATRKEWLSTEGRRGIAHKRRRLEELDRLYERAKRAGNIPLATSILEQAAKEDGGAFTNHRVLAGPNGKSIPTNLTVTFVDAAAPPEAPGEEG